MRSILEALASIGLTTAPFGFSAIVLETMAPAEAPAAQEEPERVVVLMPLDEPSKPDVQSPEEEPPSAPPPASARPVVSKRAKPTPDPVELSPGTKKTGSKAKKKEGRKTACLPSDERIQPLGPSHWAIDSDLVQSYATPSKAEQLAWTDWSRDDAGQVQGFSVRRMQCGSPLRQAGLHNGDVVLAVNGEPITSLLKGFNAWRKLRNEESFQVTVRRKDGSEQVLRYTLT